MKGKGERGEEAGRGKGERGVKGYGEGEERRRRAPRNCRERGEGRGGGSHATVRKRPRHLCSVSVYQCVSRGAHVVKQKHVQGVLDKYIGTVTNTTT